MLLNEVEVRWERVSEPDRQPFDLPFIQNLGCLRFDRAVTFVVGENGSGHDLSHDGSQFIIATHSPILTSLPGAAIVECQDDGARPTAWDDTDLVRMYRSFLEAPDAFLRHPLED